MTDEKLNLAASNLASAKLNLSISKIVATPTITSWSQAYNAGALFAVLSIEKISPEEEEDLNLIGKEILNTLEEEYFTLEVKNFASIKEALLKTCEKIPENVSSSLLISSIINDILYVFIHGNGNVFLKREDKLGVVLGLDDMPDVNDGKKLVAASGFLKNNDIIILETKQFSNIISKETLTSSLEHNDPSEVAEALSPKIHEKNDGGASAIIISYKRADALEEELEIKENLEEEIKEEEQEDDEKEVIEIIQNPPEKDSGLNSPKININFLKKYLKLLSGGFINQRKIFLIVALILIAALASGIFFSIKKQENAKTQALFQKVFPDAQKKYDEGNSLLSLNKNLARDDFLEAQKIINENKSKFKAGSNEEKQISELSKKVEDALNGALDANSIQPRAVDEGQSNILDFELKNPSFNFYTKDGIKIFSIDTKSINSSDKKEIVKNKDYWTDLGGFGTYLGNFYVLDKKSNQILKFVSTGGSFEKTDYFASGQSPDISKTQAITIDGSIWILGSDGSILKFTRGKQEDFKTSGLDKPLLNPTRIYTDKDSDKLYILDNGNSRIVILGKDGAYQSQYQAKILKPAKDFEVLEKDKKIYILTENKVWEIEIK